MNKEERYKELVKIFGGQIAPRYIDATFVLDGRVEWICEHGVGHTIESDKYDYIHGCDGCCETVMNYLNKFKKLEEKLIELRN